MLLDDGANQFGRMKELQFVWWTFLVVLTDFGKSNRFSHVIKQIKICTIKGSAEKRDLCD